MKLICTRGAAREYRDPATGTEYVSFSQVAAVLDPTAYAGADAQVMATARQRGTRVHALFSFLLGSRAGLCPPPDVPEELHGYYRAMEQWADARQATPLLIEESSTSEMGYAGTPDAKVRLVERGRTVVALIDLKTGSVRSRLHRVQVQAYVRLRDYTDCEAMRVLYVSGDGTYADLPVSRSPHDWAWFQAGLMVLRGRDH